jgi:hypothetical protein
MNNIRWVIQNNLIAENELKEIQNTCKSIGVEYEEVQSFLSSELPKFYHRRKKRIFIMYSTTFMNNIYKLLDNQRVVL